MIKVPAPSTSAVSGSLAYILTTAELSAKAVRSYPQ